MEWCFNAMVSRETIVGSAVITYHQNDESIKTLKYEIITAHHNILGFECIGKHLRMTLYKPISSTNPDCMQCHVPLPL